MILRYIALVLISLNMGCAYHFGYANRKLPGGFTQVAIPVFKNQTEFVGLESYFSNEIRRQFSRSRVAKVGSKSSSPVVLEGTIMSVSYGSGGQVEGTNDSTDSQFLLPHGAVLTTEYRVYVVVKLVLKKTSNGDVLWQGDFNDELVYSAPQIGLPVVNSVNPLYNHSARHQVISKMAGNLMAEVHDQMTENF